MYVCVHVGAVCVCANLCQCVFAGPEDQSLLWYGTKGQQWQRRLAEARENMKAAAVIMLNPHPLRRDLVMQHHSGFVRRIKHQHLVISFIRPKRRKKTKTQTQKCIRLHDGGENEGITGCRRKKTLETSHCNRFYSVIIPNPTGLIWTCSISPPPSVCPHTCNGTYTDTEVHALIYHNTVITLMISHGYLKV